MKLNRDYRKIMEARGIKWHRNKCDSLLILIWCIIGFFFLMVAAVVFAGEVDTTKAVIHHTASHDVSAATIDDWHKERGWDGIGYHFVIRKNGNIEAGRPLTKRGAHTRGRNSYIGIALTGYEEFTQEQFNSLIQLLTRLGIRNIESHHEQCPGEGIDLEEIKKEIEMGEMADLAINGETCS